MGGFAWVTLATNDSYSLGALVLAHSLRRVGTPHDLVALVTPGVSASMRSQLSTVFTLVQEVNVLDSRDEANLALLERPELGITFTKLHCWRLTQYEKCVFLDADTLVLKNCDELFEREELSAAPDPGWPDCFNSGVFVYRPSLDTFNALIKFALSKGSFDGGDQGLLNMFFSDWATKDISRHLPFIYNMVSTATYSYLPAYKQFGEDAKIAHFIGSNKPWLQYFDSETRLVGSPSGSEHIRNLLQLWWDIFCSTVHPSLSPEMLGLAGALAQLTLGVPRSAEQTAFEEHMRKQAWEQGSMDYMGRDSFDNIWRKISETLSQAPSKPEPEPVPEPQKAATETPSIKPTPESELPVLKPTEPLASTIPPTGSGDAQGISSSTAEPIAPVLQSTQDTEPSSVSALPQSSDIVPKAPSEAPTAPPVSEEAKVIPTVPHTPLVTEATPPTSPPIMPTTDAQALKVVVPTPETPPVKSTPSNLVSESIVPVQESQVQTQPPAGQEITPPVSEKSVPEQSLPVQDIPLAEAKPVLPVSQQESVAPDASLTESKSAEVPALPQQPPPTQEVPAPETKVDATTPPPLQPPPLPVQTEVPSTPVQSLSAEQPTQQKLSPETTVTPISQAPVSIVAEIKTTTEGEIAQPQTLAQISAVAEKAVVPPTCSPPTPEQIIPLPYTPVETKVATESVPQSLISEPPPPPKSEDPVKTSASVPTELTSSLVQETKPATSLPEVPKTETKPATSLPEVKKTETKPETPLPQVPKTETKPATSLPEVQKTETKPETPLPEVPKTETKPETSLPDVPKSETKPSVEQESPTTQSQVKSEATPKSEPVKQTPPQTPEASPSDQAPVPPKRRGHKGSGTSTEQGASSKPQSQQSKSSKSGQKGKK